MTDNAPSFPGRRARTPPFLLLAALLFWGWQSGLLLAGAIAGLVLESARFIKGRWDLTEQDFRRIWNFCMLLVLALVVFVFATNQEGGGWTGLLHPYSDAATRFFGVSTATFLRWLPVTFFLLVAASLFCERGSVPLSAISWLIRRRRKGSAEEGPHLDVSYPYFMVCLFSAGVHTNEGGQSYFWGLAVLMAWALWPLRSRRFGAAAWAGMLAAAVVLGFSGQRGIAALQRVLAGYNAQWIAGFLHQRTDPSQSITAIGQIGKLKLSSRIVIRLEPKSGGSPPLYLREASYRRYGASSLGQTWYSGVTESEFAALLHEPGNDSAWRLLPAKTNDSLATICSYLDGRSRETGDPEGLLPLPSGASRLEKLPVFWLKTNNAGAALAAGLGLVIFDAHYGPGATFDSPPDAGTNQLDLAVPPDEIPALDEVISGLKISGAAEPEQLLAIGQFFASHFSYSIWQGPDKEPGADETALSRFLLKSRSGHCEVLRHRDGFAPAPTAHSRALRRWLRRQRILRPRLRGARTRRPCVVPGLERVPTNMGGLRHHARVLGRRGTQTGAGPAMAFRRLVVAAISNCETPLGTG